MNAKSIQVKRTATVLRPDQSRVLLRPFSPGDPQRAGRIIARIMSLPENRVGPLVDEVFAEFSQRHQQIRKIFLERFEQVRDLLLTDEELSEQRELLIGSYFLAEYSRLGLALLDVEDPSRVIRRSDESVFGASAPYERVGHVGNVVFPSGVIQDPTNGNIRLNRCAADTSIALRAANLEDLLDWLKSSESRRPTQEKIS